MPARSGGEGDLGPGMGAAAGGIAREGIEGELDGVRNAVAVRVGGGAGERGVGALGGVEVNA